MSRVFASAHTLPDVSALSGALPVDFAAGACSRHTCHISDSDGVSVRRSDYAHGRACLNRHAADVAVSVVAICIVM